MALVEADVIGPFPIVDARGTDDVTEGGTVVLDDERTNVPALEQAGLIAKVRPFDAPTPPAKSASKPDWVAYAVTQGMSEDDAEDATRDQLAERFS